MANLLIGVDINHKECDLDFCIDLPDEVIEQVDYMYKRALEKSGMDEDTFGPTYYEQLKKEDKELADLLETAVYLTLERIMRYDSLDERVLAKDRFYKQDKDGNWYQVFSIDNEIDIDLADFPRFL